MPTSERKYEVLGLVTSGLDDGDVSFVIFIDEMKKEAHHIGAGAVIGLTFQTCSASEEFGSSRKVVKSKL